MLHEVESEHPERRRWTRADAQGSRAGTAAHMQRSHALVLDIDGTLIDDCPTPLRFDLWRDVDWDYLTPGGNAIKKRPGVDAFLDAAFSSGPVALWTLRASDGPRSSSTMCW